MNDLKHNSLLKMQEVCGGEIINIGSDMNSIYFTSICHDTRLLKPCQMFIALVGEKTNGHDHIFSAQEKGASCALVSRDISNESNIPLLLVSDVKDALIKWAIYLRSIFKGKVVALTGSAGKTTTKEIIVRILSLSILQQYKSKKYRINSSLAQVQDEGELNDKLVYDKLLYTKGNFNNDLGVPLTLSAMTRHQEYAVLELGANHLGEIAKLVQWVKPHISLLVNASEAHIGEFGSLENIVKAKGEIFMSVNCKEMSHKGLYERAFIDRKTSIINLDSPHANYWVNLASQNSSEIVLFGDNSSDLNLKVDKLSLCTGISYKLVLASDKKISEKSIEFDISQSHLSQDYLDYSDKDKADDTKTRININLPGEYNIYNALAASSVAITLSIDMDDIVKAIKSFKSVKGRVDFIDCKNKLGNFKLIDDSYNASPESVRQAIKIIKNINSPNKVFILGFMAELGQYSESLHQEVARLLLYGNVDDAGNINSGINELWLVGEQTKPMLSIIKNISYRYFSSKDNLIAELKRLPEKYFNGSYILIKGSLSSGMSDVVNYLKALT